MATNKRAVAIGIDLGTTNTCVAIWRNGIIEVIPNKLGDFVTPSWVSYTDQEVVIGKTAKDSAYKNLFGTVFGIKRIIGRKYNDPVVQEAIQNWKFTVHEDSLCRPKIEVIYKKVKRNVYPEEISALLLKEMKEIAEAFLDEENITDAVITVPAYFNDHQRQATKDAARIAGLNVLRLINEPTAAALAYVFDNPKKKEHNVLVYDLGGGTFDVSIVSLKDANVRVKATRGDTNLGGENFDQRCIEHFIKIIADKFGVNVHETKKLGLLARLRNQVEKAKHNLAATVTANIELPAVDGENDLDEDFSRARFDDLNDDLYDKTFSIVEQCIHEAGLQTDDIDDVVLVGGSTRIPRIQEGLEEFFGRAVSKAINPDQAVAHGAAILAANLSGLLPHRLHIMDVLPLSLGIETLNGEMNILVARNSQIPIEAQRIYTTGVDGENAIRITVLEGDHPAASDNLELGSFDLLDLPSNPSVEVTFQIDINGILTVDALETSSGISKTINVKLEKGMLSDNEISKLKRRSGHIIEENRKWLQVKEKRNQLESYLIKLEFDLKRNTYNISVKQKNELLNKVKNTLSWMKSEEANHLNNINNEYASINLYCTTLLNRNI